MNKQKIFKIISALLAACAVVLFLFSTKEKTIDELEMEYDEIEDNQAIKPGQTIEKQTIENGESN